MSENICLTKYLALIFNLLVIDESPNNEYFSELILLFHSANSQLAYYTKVLNLISKCYTGSLIINH